MGGRGSSSGRGGGGSGGSVAMAEELGFEFNENTASLSEETKKLVAEGVSDIINEFPGLRGRLVRVDYSENSSPNEIARIMNMPNGKSYMILSKSFKDKAAAEAEAKKEALEGWSPKNTTLKSTIHHEMAHAVDRQYFEKNYKDKLKNSEKQFSQGKTSNKLISTASKDSEFQKVASSSDYSLKSISKYAATSGHEAVAEAVADYMANGKKAAPLSQAIWRTLKKSA